MQRDLRISVFKYHGAGNGIYYDVSVCRDGRYFEISLSNGIQREGASDSTETDQAAERAIREELEKVGIKEKSWIGCHGAWLAGIKEKDGLC